MALCTTVAQNRPDNFSSYPLDNHRCSDDVYLRQGGVGIITHTSTFVLSQTSIKASQLMDQGVSQWSESPTVVPHSCRRLGPIIPKGYLQRSQPACSNSAKEGCLRVWAWNHATSRH